MAVEELVDTDLVLLLIAQTADLLDELGLEGLGLCTRLDDSLGLPTFQVQKQSRQTQSKRPGLGPIDVGQPFRRSVGTLLELQVAVSQQPGIEIDSTPERSEPVI